MSLFDRYIAVDWSAANEPRRGKDSIWIGEASGGSAISVTTANYPTRTAAIEYIRSVFRRSLETNQRLLVGFDFAFGYPVGAAAAATGTASWEALWDRLDEVVTDGPDNQSNRFIAAGIINSTLRGTGARYWGHPWQHVDRYQGLTPRKPDGNHDRVREKRIVEARHRGAQPVWKLSGAGAVGSQSLLGIPHLNRLRRDPAFAPRLAIWPFETRFAGDLSHPLVVAEIFPSIVSVASVAGRVRDDVQVETIARLFAIADQEGCLEALLDAPADLIDERDGVLKEEGWIVGIGHEELVQRLVGRSS